MDNKIKLITDSFGKEKFKFNEPIKEHTALGVGGPAKLFFVAITPREITRIVIEARKLKIPFLIFGTGSKMMISDYGFDGLVIKNRTKNLSIVGVKGKVSKSGVGVDEVLVEVESGVSINKLVDFLKHQGLRSDEFSNLPGTIGGGLLLNKFLQDKTQSVKVLNEVDEEEDITSDQLNLRKHIILSVIFKFKSN